MGCRFGSVKIDVSVPEKYDLKSFRAETQQFASRFLAMTKQKPIHYNLTFDKKQRKLAALEFNVNCTCILNVNKNDCSKFNPEQENCKIRHLPREAQTRGVQIIEPL